MNNNEKPFPASGKGWNAFGFITEFARQQQHKIRQSSLCN